MLCLNPLTVTFCWTAWSVKGSWKITDLLTGSPGEIKVKKKSKKTKRMQSPHLRIGKLQYKKFWIYITSCAFEVGHLKSRGNWDELPGMVSVRLTVTHTQQSVLDLWHILFVTLAWFWSMSSSFFFFCFSWKKT